jgi:hypothetical protein
VRQQMTFGEIVNGTRMQWAGVETAMRQLLCETSTLVYGSVEMKTAVEQ